MTFRPGFVSSYYDEVDEKTAIVPFRDFRREIMLALFDVCTPFTSSSPSTDRLDTELRLKHVFDVAVRCPPCCCLVPRLVQAAHPTIAVLKVSTCSVGSDYWVTHPNR